MLWQRIPLSKITLVLMRLGRTNAYEQYALQATANSSTHASPFSSSTSVAFLQLSHCNSCNAETPYILK